MDFFIGKSLLRGTNPERAEREPALVSVRRNPYRAARSSRRTLCDFSASIMRTACSGSVVELSSLELQEQYDEGSRAASSVVIAAVNVLTATITILASTFDEIALASYFDDVRNSL